MSEKARKSQLCERPGRIRNTTAPIASWNTAGTRLSDTNLTKSRRVYSRVVTSASVSWPRR